MVKDFLGFPLLETSLEKFLGRFVELSLEEFLEESLKLCQDKSLEKSLEDFLSFSSKLREIPKEPVEQSRSEQSLWKFLCNI